MLKKIILNGLCLAAFTMSNLSLAASESAKNLSPTMPANNAATSSQLILIYELPDLKSKIVQKTDIANRLIPIFSQDKWIKVGDPKNGQVGWVNKDQYQHAIQALYQPNVQTVFIRTDQKDGKPIANIVAYKNGKQLTEDEAKKLYEQIKKNQAAQAEYFQKMFFNMNRLMQQNFQGIGPVIVQPVMVISPDQEKKKSEQNNKDKIKTETEKK